MVVSTFGHCFDKWDGILIPQFFFPFDIFWNFCYGKCWVKNSSPHFPSGSEKLLQGGCRSSPLWPRQVDSGLEQFILQRSLQTWGMDTENPCSAHLFSWLGCNRIPTLGLFQRVFFLSFIRYLLVTQKIGNNNWSVFFPRKCSTHPGRIPSSSKVLQGSTLETFSSAA